MKIGMVALAMAGACAFAAPAAAKCADDIKAMQSKAAERDAAVKPGQQTKTTSPGTQPAEGGGAASASAKILEAQAHDQRGDEANCMKALEEAKKLPPS